MKVFGVVYLIWNMVNGKKYVGQTVKTVKARFNEHARQNGIIGRAIRKYGKKNFRYGVIKSCVSKADMDYWEKYFIATLKSKKPDGYNQTDGGEGIVGLERTPEQCFNHAVRHRKDSPFKNLRFEMDARQMSGTALAQLLGMIQQTFSEKMRGRKNFTAKDVDKLVKVFELPAEYLLARDDGLPTMISGVKGFAKLPVKYRGSSPFKNLIAEMDANRILGPDIAKLLKLTHSTLFSKMRGELKFTEIEAAKLVEFFNKPAEYLLARDDGLPARLSRNHQTPFKNLLNAIIEQGFSYTSLAELMRLAQQTFSSKMRCKKNFTAKDKAKLVEIFNKPIEYLFFKEEFL